MYMNVLIRDTGGLMCMHTQYKSNFTGTYMHIQLFVGPCLGCTQDNVVFMGFKVHGYEPIFSGTPLLYFDILRTYVAVTSIN